MAAKKRKKQERPDDSPGIPMTPMIDIIFLLLIFFMLSCKFRTIEGKIKAFLPKDRGQGVEPAVKDLGEMRVKLLWADMDNHIYPQRKKGTSFDDYFNRVKNGKVVLKVGDHGFPEVAAGWPDYRILYGHIVEGMKIYTPPSTTPEKVMPVIIDARETVEWKHAVAVMNAAIKAGITELSIAAPEIPY